MDQKIPNISNHDIERIIKRDFQQHEFAEIKNLLENYETDNKKGRNRIYASILKLSEGKIPLVKKYVEKANNDYRDVITLSEYPNYFTHAFDDNLPKATALRLINDDWIQYEDWFNKNRTSNEAISYPVSGYKRMSTHTAETFA